jgi:hypothetical protein
MKTRMTHILQLMPIIQTHYKTGISRNGEEVEGGKELSHSTITGLILIPTSNRTSEFSRVGKFEISDYEEDHVFWEACKCFDTLPEARAGTRG